MGPSMLFCNILDALKSHQVTTSQLNQAFLTIIFAKYSRMDHLRQYSIVQYMGSVVVIRFSD
jgi:hypothetical protein